MAYNRSHQSEQRRVPLEIMVPGRTSPSTNQDISRDLGIFKATPVLPFATKGKHWLGPLRLRPRRWPSQFLSGSCLRGKNSPPLAQLIDGPLRRLSAYVVDGFEVLEELTGSDGLFKATVLEGAENLRPMAEGQRSDPGGPECESGLLERIAAFCPPGQLDALIAGPAAGTQRRCAGAQHPMSCGRRFTSVMPPRSRGFWACAPQPPIFSDLAANGCQEVIDSRVAWCATRHSVELGAGVYRGRGARPPIAYGGDLLAAKCKQRPAAPAGDHRPWDAWGRPGRSAPRWDGPGDRLIRTGPHALSRSVLAVLGAEAAAALPARQLAGAGLAAHAPPPTPLRRRGALFDASPRSALAGGGRMPTSSDGPGPPAVRGDCPQQRLRMPSLPTAGLPCRWPPQWMVLPRPEACVSGGGKDFELILGLDAGLGEPCSKALPGPADRPALRGYGSSEAGDT